jgi:hypothetical protein
MRTRNHEWLNIKTLEVSYGIEVKDTDGKWKHYCEAKNSAVWLTNDPKERDNKRAELRKIKLVNQVSFKKFVNVPDIIKIKNPPSSADNTN